MNDVEIEIEGLWGGDDIDPASVKLQELAQAMPPQLLRHSGEGRADC